MADSKGKGLLYYLDLKDDGLWLVLNGNRHRAAINLSVLKCGPIVRVAIKEVARKIEQETERLRKQERATPTTKERP